MANPYNDGDMSGDIVSLPKISSTLLGSGKTGLYTGDRLAALSDSGFINSLNGADINAMSGLDLDKSIKNYTQFGNKIPGVTTDNGLSNNTNWGMDGLGGTLVGAGQLGLGVLSYLDAKKTADLNRQLGAQKIASNQYMLDKSKADTAHLQNVFNQKA